MTNPVTNSLAPAILSALLYVAPAVHAQTPYSFDLPSQSLVDSLCAVGSNRGVNVGFNPAFVQGRIAPALHGRYFTRDALERVLEGSDLTLQATTSDSFLVRAADATPASAPPVVPAETSAFHLPAQTLSTTLEAISKATGQTIRVGGGLSMSLIAVPVEGVMTPLEAVRTALTGTGLRVQSSADGELTVLALDHDAAAAPKDEVTEMDKFVVTAKFEGLAAMRVPTELREIPQSVSLVDQATLKQQNANDLAAAMDHMTGISLNAGSSTRSTLFSRGFAIGGLHVDGSAPLGFGSDGTQLNDLSEYDRIEVLRGADALFGGAGDPGGSINLVRKRPLESAGTQLILSLGSSNDRRLQVDTTGPLAEDGALRGRVVASVARQDYFYDDAERDNRKLYGILEYDVGPNTRLSLGGSFEDSNARPNAAGLPLYDDGSDPRLPRSTGLVFRQNRQQDLKREGFAQVSHDFSQRWKLKAGATMVTQSGSSMLIGNQSPINPVTGLADTTRLQTTSTQERARQYSAEATLSGSWDWNGRRQDFVVGADYVRNIVPALVSRSGYVVGPPLDAWAFDPGAYAIAPASTEKPVTVLNLGSVNVSGIGLYTSLRVRPWAGWSLIIGARDNFLRSYDGADNDGYDIGRDGIMPVRGSTATRTRVNSVVTPYAGVTYDVSKQYSLYGSYAEIYRPNNDRRTVQGDAIPPTRGVNMEVGVKATWLSGRMNGSLAAFKIRQRNVAMIDFLNFSGDFYVPSENTSKGFEAELSGFLSPAWQWGSGYTYNKNRTMVKVPRDQLEAKGQSAALPLSTITPKYLFKLWTNYQFPGELDAWSIGGGLNAQSEIYSEGVACTKHDATGCIGDRVPFHNRQGFYAVATLRAAYQISPHWSVALNVNNLFDRRYYQTIGNTYYGNWYGVPRNAMLALTGDL